MPQQIIIADGGHNLKPLLTTFAAQLNLICLYCPEIGQIMQRNHAHTYLDKSIKLVLHLDDDTTLEPDAISEMISFWNEESKKSAPPLAGISFNVQDLPKVKPSALRKLFFLNSEPAGHVSKAGYAAPFAPTENNLRTSWLLGATAWSREVLKKHPHPINFPTRWAVCEDLIYSYQLKNKYRLMVAARARSYHNETYDKMSFQQGIFYGVSGTIMRYHFVRLNPELRVLPFLWMTLGVIIGNLGRGIFGSPRHIGLSFGGMEGFYRVLVCSLAKGDSNALAEL